MPAASKHASASRSASRATSLPRAAGPHAASIALPRFISSFWYFHRMMSSRGSDSKVDDSSAAAIMRAVMSTPVGYLPTSSSPVVGDEYASTTPASRWPVGHMTHMP